MARTSHGSVKDENQFTKFFEVNWEYVYNKIGWDLHGINKTVFIKILPNDFSFQIGRIKLYMQSNPICILYHRNYFIYIYHYPHYRIYNAKLWCAVTNLKLNICFLCFYRFCVLYENIKLFRIFLYIYIYLIVAYIYYL